MCRTFCHDISQDISFCGLLRMDTNSIVRANLRSSAQKNCAYDETSLLMASFTSRRKIIKLSKSQKNQLKKIRLIITISGWKVMLAKSPSVLLLPTFICYASQISLIFYQDRDLCVERANQLSLINGRILRLARIREPPRVESAGRACTVAGE